MNIENLKTNNVEAFDLTATTLSAGTLTVPEATIHHLSADTIDINTSLTIENLGINILNVINLHTTNITVDTLFSEQITAQNVVPPTGSSSNSSNTVNTSGTSSTLFKVLLGVGIALAIIGIAALTYGAGVAVMVADVGVAGVGFGVSLSAGATVLGCIQAAAALSASFSTFMTAATVTAVAGVGTVVASAVVATTGHQLQLAASQPDRSLSLNASAGHAFLSDIVVGTTTYHNHSAGFVDCFLIQNEINGSYALPRFIGYNPQLAAFDDAKAYGSTEAYLSFCTDAPYYTLRFQADSDLAIYSSPSLAPVWSAGTQISSAKYKENIQPIEHAGDKILQLEGISYEYAGKKHVGLVAQQLLSVLEEAVYGSDETGYRVRLERVIPLLIEGMKEVYEAQEILINAS